MTEIILLKINYLTLNDSKLMAKQKIKLVFSCIKVKVKPNSGKI